MSNDIDSVMTNSMSSIPHQQPRESANTPAQGKMAQEMHSSRDARQQIPLSDKDVSNIVNAANQILETQSTAVRFKVDKKDGEMVTSIYNTKTNEVIREIPSQELRDISARLKEYQNATDQAGLFVDQLV
ncbi:MAG: hypothetical protein CENE_00360 [Candidatus Celerinatantimonas neptuna]|nr:MAG: hypothetical protein CENE_00360 [Candidatus Celerinatantimonas neptuna]